jgi:hypothetical protein
MIVFTLIIIAVALALLMNSRTYLKQLYRLSASPSKRTELVWEDLKNFMSVWKCGVYEQDKAIESGFFIDESDQNSMRFSYWVNDENLSMQAIILENFSEELTLDLFVLATHFNNLLRRGVVTIDVNEQRVYYRQELGILNPLLYVGDIYWMHETVHNTAKDIYWAFQKLVEENEEPALIIADLLTMKDAEKEQNKNELL